MTCLSLRNEVVVITVSDTCLESIRRYKIQLLARPAYRSYSSNALDDYISQMLPYGPSIGVLDPTYHTWEHRRRVKGGK